MIHSSLRPLHLYDTASRSVRRFEPRSAKSVSMYSCGPTVYSRAHLGNMRAYVFADTVRRALLWKGYDVCHVINITDVGHLLADADFGDDKVEMAARNEGRRVWDLTDHYTRAFKDDGARLDLLPPRQWTTATDYVPAMIDFARRLEQTGHAYTLPQGLYFDTSTIPDYGAMATMAHDTEASKGRIRSLDGKRHPADFALWRSFPPDEPSHAMEWDSPWGRGAPGWHLECSVMSIDALGAHFDIHTGGVDHREVHHPNEDAQSRAYIGDGEPWVNWWMHVEFVQFEGDKMSKSKGNVLCLDDLDSLGTGPLAYKLLLMASHYRRQVTVGPAGLLASDNRYRRLVETVQRRLGNTGAVDPDRPLLDYASVSETLAPESPGAAIVDQMDEAISDDLATPRILALLDRALRSELDEPSLLAVLESVRSLTGIDLIAEEAAHGAPGGHDVNRATAEAVEEVVARREAARRARDFALADQLRDELMVTFGVAVVDTSDGPTWQFAASAPSS